MTKCGNQGSGIVHFEIIFWYVLAYLKGIQDVGVFVSALVSILIFLGHKHTKKLFQVNYPFKF